MSPDNQLENSKSGNHVPDMTPRWLISLLRKYGEDDAILMGEQIRPHISFEEDSDFFQAETVVPGMTDVLDEIAANAPTVPSDRLASSIEWGNAPDEEPEPPVTSSAMDDLLASFGDSELDEAPAVLPEPDEESPEPEDWGLPELPAVETPEQPVASDIPAWLDEFEQPEADISAAPLFAEPEAEETPAPGDVQTEQTDVPEWLMQFAAGSGEIAPEAESDDLYLSSPVDDDTDPPPALTVPDDFSTDSDWLDQLGFSSDESSAAAAPSADSEVDEDDWLSELGLSESEMVKPKPVLPPVEAEPVEDIDWLTDLEAEDTSVPVQSAAEPVPVDGEPDDEWDTAWLAELARTYPSDPQNRDETIPESPVEEPPTPTSVTSMLDMGQVPDWLDESAPVEDDDLLAEEAFTFADDVPDWMSDLDAIAAESDEPDMPPPAQPESNPSQPDWLASLRRGLQDVSIDESDDQFAENIEIVEDDGFDFDEEPDELPAFSEAEIPIVEDAIDDYVADLPADVPAEKPAFELDLPDWMQDLTDDEDVDLVSAEPFALSPDDAEPSPSFDDAPESSEEADEPEFLSPAPEVSQAAVDIDLEGSEDEEPPDWLENLSALQEEALTDDVFDAANDELLTDPDEGFEPAKPAMVDSLLDLGEPDQPVKPVAAVEEEIPDWLADLRQEIDKDMPETESAATDTGDLDWLTGPQVPQLADESLESVAEPEAFDLLDDDDDNVPGWLSDLRLQADEEDVSLTAGTDSELPDIGGYPFDEADELLEGPEIEERFTASAEEDVPDWLAGLQAADAQSEPELAAPDETAFVEEADLPDWMLTIVDPETVSDLDPAQELLAAADENEDAFEYSAIEAEDTALFTETVPDVTEDLLIWEEEPIETDAEPDSEDDDVPDWLAALRHDAGEDEEIDAAELVGEDPFALPDDDNRPGWLIDRREEDGVFGIGLADRTPLVEPESEAEFASGLDSADAVTEEPAADSSDWLQELPDQIDDWDAETLETDVQQPGEVVDSPEPDDAELPDWLQELPATEAEIPGDAQDISEEALEIADDTPDWLMDLRQSAEPIFGDDKAETEEIEDFAVEDAAVVEPVLSDEPVAEEEEDLFEIPEWMQVSAEDDAEPELPVEAVDEIEPVIEDDDFDDVTEAVPAWMQELDDTEWSTGGADEVEDTTSSLAPVELPPWMQDLTEDADDEAELESLTEAIEDEESTETDADDIPAWMQELGDTELEETGAGEGEDHVVAAVPVELPPWMQGLAEDEAGTTPSIEPDGIVDEESEALIVEDEADEIPDWLAEPDDAEAEGGSAGDLAPAADLPEWMQDLPRPDLDPTLFAPEESEFEEFSAETPDVPDWGEGMVLDAPEEFSVADIDIDGEDISLPAYDEVDEDDVLVRTDIADILAGKEPESEPAEAEIADSTQEFLAEVSGVLSTPAGLESTLPPGTLTGTDQAALEFYDVVNPVLESPAAVEEAHAPKKLFGKVVNALLNVIFLLLIAFPLFTHYDRGGYPFPWLEPSLAAQEEIQAQLQSVVGIHPPESIALVAFDYSPAFEGEMEPLANAVVKQLLGQGMRVIAVSLEPEGQAIAGTVLKNVTGSDDYGSKVINLGYLPGGPIAVRRLTFEGALANAVDVQSEIRTPYKDLIGWPEIKTITDVNLVVEITAKPDTARWWVEQLQPANPDYSHPMLLAVVSAAAEPFVRPYWDSHQYAGLIAGINGAAALENARPQKELGPATAQLDSQSVAHLLILILMLLGTIAGFISKYGQESN